jgi:hypothetical protein
MKCQAVLFIFIQANEYQVKGSIQQQIEANKGYKLGMKPTRTKTEYSPGTG